MTLTLSRWLDAMHNTDTARTEATAEFDRVVGGDDVASLWLGLPARPTIHPVAITAYRMGRTDILTLLAERTIQIDSEIIDREGAWLDTLSADRLSLVLAVHSPSSQRSSIWMEPSPLLLSNVAKKRTVDPFEVNWTSAADMKEELVCLAIEELVDSNNAQGNWKLTKSYYRYAHVERQLDLTLAVLTDDDTGNPYLPVVVTTQTNVAGLLGPATRSDVHRLYREDGTYIERAKPFARTYDRDAMIAAGESRREYAIKYLTGSLNSLALANGINPNLVMANVLPEIPVFREAALAGTILTALAAWPVLHDMAEERLAPWL